MKDTEGAHIIRHCFVKLIEATEKYKRVQCTKEAENNNHSHHNKGNNNNYMLQRSIFHVFHFILSPRWDSGLSHIWHGGRRVYKIYGLYGGRSISTVTQCSSHICFYFSGSRTAYLSIVETENGGEPYGF